MAERDVLYVKAVAAPAGSLEELALYIDEELEQISRALGVGAFQTMRLIPWGTLPPRPRPGDIAYLLADAGQEPPAQEGLYMWDRNPGAGRWEPIKVISDP